MSTSASESNPLIDAQYDQFRTELTNYLVGGGKLAVVKAPPGSGKTHTLIEVLTALVRHGQRIAVAAQTNSQADDICARWSRTYPQIAVTRFAGNASAAPAGFPPAVPWVTDKNLLPTSPGITVSTTAKWSLTELADPYDLLAVDEAWQTGWADLMQCATVSGRFLLIGDPGQIPPVVTVDVRRWETSPRAPHLPAPDVVLAEPALAGVRFVCSLPSCRRLPCEAVGFVRPFYDFEFSAYVPRGSRKVVCPMPWAAPLAKGYPVVLTIPTPPNGPPIELDQELAATAAQIVTQLLNTGATVTVRDTKPIDASDIGITSTHRVMNTAIVTELFRTLGDAANQIRVDTPERWQGLERPIMLAVHPLSGVNDPSAFDIETGRLCVMASRHEAALILLTRDHIGETLRNFVPSAEQAPGRPDTVGRGHDAHLKFWEQLEGEKLVVPLNGSPA